MLIRSSGSCPLPGLRAGPGVWEELIDKANSENSVSAREIDTDLPSARVKDFSSRLKGTPFLWMDETIGGVLHSAAPQCRRMSFRTVFREPSRQTLATESWSRRPAV